MSENHYVTSYKEVSTELGKKLVKLYGVKIFPRQGKIFADMLFQSGVEAGSYLAALEDIEERTVKINLATNAMVQLNQTEYLIGVMLEAGYYLPAHVAEIQEYLDGLTHAMKELLISAYSTAWSDNTRQTAANPPKQGASSPKSQSESFKADKPKAAVISPFVDMEIDGFNVPAGNKN